MKKKYFLMSALYAALLLFCFTLPAGSADPPINFADSVDIVLSFDKPGDKPVFAADDPIGLRVTVSYAGPSIYISEGFQAKEYYLEMRVLDPTNKPLLVQQSEPVLQEVIDLEVPDAPPLPTERHPVTKKFVVKVNCEELVLPFEETSYTPDLRNHYDLGLPGPYSVQVRLSAMVFGEDPCDLYGFLWKGTWESDTRYFYIEGITEGVKVVPENWSTKWEDPKKNVPDLLVQIWPDENETTADFDPASFLLNNTRARRVVVLKPMIKAYFPAKKVFATLGDPLVGQTRTVNITGRYQTANRSYGRLYEIKIVN